MSDPSQTPRSYDVLPIAVAVVCWQSQFLVGVRGADQESGGCHEFPGGKVQPGESPADAAARECLEETGIALRIDRLLNQVDHTYEYGFLRLYFFAATPRSAEGDPLQPRGSFRWICRSELERCRFPAANQIVVSQLLASEL